MLATGCIALVIFSWRWGTANLYFKKADYYIQHWNESKNVKPEIFEDALSAINIALLRHPQHPHYWATRAKIYQWGAFGQIGDADDLLHSAKSDFLQSAKMRPIWPIVWIDLAQVESDLSDYHMTDAAYQYIEKANETGPYLKEVLQTEMFLLSRSWSELNTQQRLHYFSKIDSLTGNQPLLRNSLNLAKQYGFISNLCLYLNLTNEKSDDFQINTKILNQYCPNA